MYSFSFYLGTNNVIESWDVTYTRTEVEKDYSTYRINGSTVDVISCSFDCNVITKSSIITTDDETHYPSTQGWKKILRIHQPHVFLYIRAREDGKLDVKYRWNTNINDVDIGIGIKDGMYSSLIKLLRGMFLN